MTKKKESKPKPQPKEKDFTRKDFMNILELAVNPKQGVNK
jgi:hypothetical protein